MTRLPARRFFRLVITSVCGAEATGRIFSGGTLDERISLLLGYGAESKGQPAALVLTSKELTELAVEGAAGQQLPANVSDIGVNIDNAGLHASAKLAAGPLNLTAKADIVAGQQNGKLILKMRNIDAGILPAQVKQQILEQVNSTLARSGGELPLVVQRVAFRFRPGKKKLTSLALFRLNPYVSAIKLYNFLHDTKTDSSPFNFQLIGSTLKNLENLFLKLLINSDAVILYPEGT